MQATTSRLCPGVQINSLPPKDLLCMTVQKAFPRAKHLAY